MSRLIVLVLVGFLLSACTSDLQSGAAAVAVATVQQSEWQAQRTATQQKRDDEIDALRLEAEQRKATLQAVKDVAALLSLTPEPTRTLTPSPVPTSTPVPTPCPTPDVTSTARAASRANAVAEAQAAGSIGLWIGLPLAIVLGLLILAAALANRIEADANAKKIVARAEARAIEIRANAEAERSHHWQVGGNTNIVSTTPDGVRVVSISGSGAQSEVQAFPPMPTFKRLTNGGRRVDDVVKLSPLSQQAVDYLRECATLVGWESQKLPAASETGDNSTRQPVINALKDQRRCHTVKGNPVDNPNAGTWLVGEYKTIRDLHDALMNKEVSL